MKNTTRLTLTAGLGIALLQPLARAVDKPSTPPPPAAQAAPDTSGFTDQKTKLSYSVGMMIGNNLKGGGYDVDLEVLSGAIKDVLAGRNLKLTDVQARETLNAYGKEMQAKRTADRLKTAEKNRQEGEAFLAENKKKEGVKTRTVTLRDGKSTAEMQYKVITEGTGPELKSNDLVLVNYKGTTINGKEFDSSAKRGQPGKFTVNRGIIPGWTEALEMMKVGSKWEIYLPSALAYQDFGQGAAIEPGSTLIFELEVVGIDNPQPLTSDIIRVPSKEGLEAGEKVEVLKAEDVARQIQSNSAAKPAGKP